MRYIHHVRVPIQTSTRESLLCLASLRVRARAQVSMQAASCTDALRVLAPSMHMDHDASAHPLLRDGCYQGPLAWSAP